MAEPSTRPIYLDNHATTRCDPAVAAAMAPYLAELYGNPASRSHVYGTEARAATERARAQVAAWLGASPKEIVFTSGATEADNLAILGAARARREREGRDHVLTVATEHPAVLDPVQALARAGFAVTVLPVGPDGRVDPDDVARALRPTTAIASVMLVNNEIGVIQPIPEIAARCAAVGAWLHCDAAQSAYVPVDVEALGADLVSVSGHKVYGPKGVGALVVRRRRPRIELEPLMYGGGHERGLRSGTLAVPLVVGLGEAAAMAVDERADAVPRLTRLRDRLFARVRDAAPDVALNGHPTERAPNNLSLAVPVEAAALVMAVREVVALSTGSACSSDRLAPSHVLEALARARGGPADLAQRTVRIGLGRFTTDADVDLAASALIDGIERLRGLAALYE